MPSDIRLISKTDPARCTTSGDAALGTFINTVAGGLLITMLAPGVVVGTLISALVAGADYLYGTTAIDGWMRYFKFKDYSTGEVRTEQYIYSSYTDALNNVGGEFLGATDGYGNLYKIDIKH